MFLNNNPYFMFHEVLDNNSRESGWHLKSKGKYTITKQLFLEIIRKYGKTINYTFDDGGVSNLFSANQLKSHKIRGIYELGDDFAFRTSNLHRSFSLCGSNKEKAYHRQLDYGLCRQLTR